MVVALFLYKNLRDHVRIYFLVEGNKSSIPIVASSEILCYVKLVKHFLPPTIPASTLQHHSYKDPKVIKSRYICRVVVYKE